MIYSDRWVKDSRDPNNQLVAQVEAELVQSYSALRQAVNPAPGAAPNTRQEFSHVQPHQ
jgi:hypothetical protein